MSDFTFDWNELAFGSKKDVRNLKATFIAAPREISSDRFAQLVKLYLPLGNIVIGIAKEGYIGGFEDQLQFRTLRLNVIKPIIDKVNSSKSPYKVYVLTYQQRDVRHIYEKDLFKRVVLINGSWKSSFHTKAEYYTLVSKNTPFEKVSPFADDTEAKTYAKSVTSKLDKNFVIDNLTRTEVKMLDQASEIAKRSFDYGFQTGAVIAKKQGSQYKTLLRAWNKVVPYETFAMHHGALREKNLSPPNDLNHYDTIHAEEMLIIEAQKNKVDLKGATLFINLLPCPTCARLICESDIAELVYAFDHSEGYAVALLENAGKKVRRVVSEL